jgi:hypothetical protein
MEHIRAGRHRSAGFAHDGHSPRGRRHHSHSKHKQWVADGGGGGGVIAARTLSTTSSSGSGGGGDGGDSPMILTDSGGGERWERGRGHHRGVAAGGRGGRAFSYGGRGATFRHAKLMRPSPLSQFQLSADAAAASSEVEEDSEMLNGEEEEGEEEAIPEIEEPVLETSEEREKFWQEVGQNTFPSPPPSYFFSLFSS